MSSTKVLLEKRPATLIGRFTETMPDSDIRPIRENAAVREEAAANVYPLVEAAWPGVDPDRLRDAFVNAVRWDSDPEAITRKMVAKLKCEPGASFAHALEQLAHEVDLCHELMIKAWVRARGVKPRFSEGDAVVATLRPTLFETKTVSGKVTEIDLDLATYTIMTKEEGKAQFHIVNFEAVSGREEPKSKEPNLLSIFTGTDE